MALQTVCKQMIIKVKVTSVNVEHLWGEPEQAMQSSVWLAKTSPVYCQITQLSLLCPTLPGWKKDVIEDSNRAII